MVGSEHNGVVWFLLETLGSLGVGTQMRLEGEHFSVGRRAVMRWRVGARRLQRASKSRTTLPLVFWGETQTETSLKNNRALHVDFDDQHNRYKPWRAAVAESSDLVPSELRALVVEWNETSMAPRHGKGSARNSCAGETLCWRVVAKVNYLAVVAETFATQHQPLGVALRLPKMQTWSRSRGWSGSCSGVRPSTHHRLEVQSDHIMAYTDSDLAADREICRSTSGGMLVDLHYRRGKALSDHWLLLFGDVSRCACCPAKVYELS